MNCRGVLDALSEYLEGEAGSTICRKIEEHLKGCKRCRMHIDTMKKVIVLYKKWRAEPIPEDVQTRLRNVVARECVLKGLDPPTALTSKGGRKTKKSAARPKRKTAGRKKAKSSKRRSAKR